MSVPCGIFIEANMQEQKQQEIGHVTGQKQMAGQNIGIVGGGLMGHGIAYLCAAAGHTVAIFEPAADLRASLPQRLHAIAALLDDDAAVIDRIAVYETLASAMRDVAFVFEAAPEK